MRTALARKAAILTLCLQATVCHADSQPFEFTHTVDFEGLDLDVPVQVWMTAVDDNRIDLKVAGNLKSVQDNLPKILSDVVQDDCDRRIAFQIDEGHPEGNKIRMNGRVQIHLFTCSDPEDFDTRVRLLTNIISIDALIEGAVKNNCVEGKLEELTIDPSGFVGGLLNVLGLTATISSVVREDINALLNEDKNCFDLPDALKKLNSQIVSGGFRDFGNDNLGIVVKGRIDIRAPSVVNLFELLANEGILDD